MTRKALGKMSVEELVDYFAEIGIGRDDAQLDGDISRINRLFGALMAVENELRSRPDDRRAALCRLYMHDNLQVRLDAAKATLAVAPEQARKLLEAIANSQEYPQAGDAGMCLWTLDEGIFKPE
jgi:hypothetical protein